MSTDAQQDGSIESRKEEFRDLIRETLAPWTKSRQYEIDHPDGAGDAHPHNIKDPDGHDIYKEFHLEPLPKYLGRASNQDHALGRHPKALPHFLTHIEKWEKWELGEDDPDLDDLPRLRRQLFEWYLGVSEHEYDGEGHRHPDKAKQARMKRLRPGGTGMIIHGEQGTTKTTGIYWLVTNIMEVNQKENIVWQSTLDDTEWQVFAPWATLCLPEGVDVTVEANPHGRGYRDLGAFEISPGDIARQVIRYSSPEDLLLKFANRSPGQIYVVYPDPHFRGCQALTGWPYESIWDADSSDEATNIKHFWFGLMEGLNKTPEYNDWTTIVADEAHKWLQDGASDDEHKWHKKIKQWATYWGDARKKRLSAILAIHKWHEINWMVKEKIRWGATMNGEDFPSEAPLDGKNRNQDLGEMCVWNNLEWNHVGYPDLKRNFSVPADISVTYPGFDRVKQEKS